MVGLARELEGERFHLVASFNQHGTEDVALFEAFQNGLEVDATNVTATLHSNHRQVTGIKYVPYYMLFDQHGNLVHHHQGGPYHGGDGDEVHDRVRKLLRDLDPVYVGRKPYERHAKLAASIASGKDLAKQWKQLKKARESTPEDFELLRLESALESHVSARLAAFEEHALKNVGEALERLKADAKLLVRTPFRAPLDARIDALNERAERKRYDAARDAFADARSTWRRLGTLKGHGGEVRNPLDPRFRRVNQKELGSLGRKLAALEAEYGGLQAGTRAATWRRLVERELPKAR